MIVVAGTRSGKVIGIKIPEDGDHDCCSDDFARKGHWFSFQAHAKLAIWKCVVTPYEFMDHQVVKKTYVLITSSGDNNVKMWSVHQLLQLMDGETSDESMQAFTTLSMHTGAVTAMVCIASSTIGEASANVEVQCQSYALFTGSWDGECKRWVLGDILGNLSHDRGSETMWRIPIKSQNCCGCLFNFLENLLHTNLHAHMPQQVYRSSTLFEVIASPISWCCALCQLALGIVNAGGSPTNKGETSVPFFFGLVGPRIPFWWEYLLVSIAAWIYVFVLIYDAHNRIKAKIHEVQSSTTNTTWKAQQQVLKFKSKLGMVHMFLWGFSQVLWMSTLKFLVMAFDCTHLSKINNSETWLQSVKSMYHYDGDVMVIDEDRSVQCFTGWHLHIAIHGCILNWLFGWVSLPLLVGLGDSNLVLPTRYLVQCTPLQLYNILKFRAQRLLWPKYAGAFSRETTYYYFETALMASKIMIPMFIIVTTYMTAFREICCMFMGIAVFFFAAYTTPVTNRYPSLLIIGCSLMLIVVSFTKFYIYEQGKADYYLEALLNNTNRTAADYPYKP